MAQKIPLAVVQGADGEERLLAYVRQSGGTAYVCPVSKYETAAADPTDKLVVGFPIECVRRTEELGQPSGLIPASRG